MSNPPSFPYDPLLPHPNVEYFQQQLRLALEHNDLQAVDQAVRNGANIRAFLPDYIAEHSSLEIINYLATHGMDFRADDVEQVYPLSTAIEAGRLDVATYLVNHGADIREGHDMPIFTAVADGNLDIVEFLVARGLDLSAVGRLLNGGEETLLDVAVLDGRRLDIVRYLVEHGVSANDTDWINREEAVRYALESNFLTIASYLISLDIEHYLMQPEFADYTQLLLDTFATVHMGLPHHRFDPLWKDEIMTYVFPSEIIRNCRQYRRLHPLPPPSPPHSPPPPSRKRRTRSP